MISKQRRPTVELEMKVGPDRILYQREIEIGSEDLHGTDDKSAMSVFLIDDVKTVSN
jgi:hypothetical protein